MINDIATVLYREAKASATPRCDVHEGFLINRQDLELLNYE